MRRITNNPPNVIPEWILFDPIAPDTSRSCGYGTGMSHRIVDVIDGKDCTPQPTGKGAASLTAGSGTMLIDFGTVAGSALRSSELKTMIVDWALAGVISAAEAQDLIAFYGLRHV
jgi:hypothetical protein